MLPTVQVPPFDIEQPYVTAIDGMQLSSYIDSMKSCYCMSIAGVACRGDRSRRTANRAQDCGEGGRGLGCLGTWKGV